MLASATTEISVKTGRDLAPASSWSTAHRRSSGPATGAARHARAAPARRPIRRTGQTRGDPGAVNAKVQQGIEVSRHQLTIDTLHSFPIKPPRRPDLGIDHLGLIEAAEAMCIAD